MVVPSGLEGSFAAQLARLFHDQPGLAIRGDGFAPSDATLPWLACENQALLVIADDEQTGQEAEGVILAGGDLILSGQSFDAGDSLGERSALRQPDRVGTV